MYTCPVGSTDPASPDVGILPASNAWMPSAQGPKVTPVPHWAPVALGAANGWPVSKS
jgi:hypothetical protein